MSKEVYLLKEGAATAMQDMCFKNEYELQQIIERNPNLLLRESDKKAKNELFLVEREMTLPGTLLETTDLSLDHFMVDKFGVPVLVEVKLMSNPEIRRKVVGQMMEYAARITSFDSAELQELFAKRTNKEAPVEDSRKFWATVSSNLRAGRMRLVFAADEIPNALKLIIEMLDRTMRYVDVYGVEIRKHTDDSQIFLSTSFVLNTAKTLIPQEETKWTDQDLKERINKSEYAFFQELRVKCGSLDLYGEYYSVKSFISHRWYFKNKAILSFAVGSSRPAVYFFTNSIANLTNDALTNECLFKMVSSIDPEADYEKEETQENIRTKAACYEDPRRKAQLFDLLDEIVSALE